MAINKEKITANAMKYLQKGALDKAVKEFKKILDSDPNDERTLQKVGDLHARMGKNDEAIAAYKRVSDIYIKQGFYQKAIAVYKQILAIQPDKIELHEKLAELYQQLGLTSETIQAFEFVAKYYEEQGQSKQALQILKKIAVVDPQNLPSRIRLAEGYVNEDMLEEGLEEYEKILTDLSRMEREDDYIRVLDRFYQHAPERVDRGRELAKLLLARDETKKALVRLQNVLKHDAESLETLELLAESFFKLNQLAKTITVYREMARILRDKDDLNRLRQTYKRILEIDPENQEAKQGLAVIPFEDGLPTSDLAGEESGLEDIRSVSEMGESLDGAPAAASPGKSQTKDDSASYIRMITEADVFIKYGLLEQAELRLKTILEQFPENVEALLKLRDLYVGQSNNEDALPVLLRASFSALKDGDSIKSRQCLQDAMELDVDTDIIQGLLEKFDSLAPAEMLAEIQRFIRSYEDMGKEQEFEVDLSGNDVLDVQQAVAQKEIHLNSDDIDVDFDDEDLEDIDDGELIDIDDEEMEFDLDGDDLTVEETPDDLESDIEEEIELIEPEEIREEAPLPVDDEILLEDEVGDSEAEILEEVELPQHMAAPPQPKAGPKPPPQPRRPSPVPQAADAEDIVVADDFDSRDVDELLIEQEIQAGEPESDSGVDPLFDGIDVLETEMDSEVADDVDLAMEEDIGIDGLEIDGDIEEIEVEAEPEESIPEVEILEEFEPEDVSGEAPSKEDESSLPAVGEEEPDVEEFASAPDETVETAEIEIDESEEFAEDETPLEDLLSEDDYDEFEEAEFFYDQGVYDECVDVYVKLSEKYPSSIELRKRVSVCRENLDAEELEREAAYKDKSPEEVASARQTIAKAMEKYSEELGGDLFESTFDLGVAKELEKEKPSKKAASPQAEPPADGSINLSEEIMAGLDLDDEEDEAGTPEGGRGFRVADDISDDDVETHLNLGIAYKEMGMVDEAIGELLIASNGVYAERANFMLATCYVGKRLLEKAATFVGKALESGSLTRSSLFGFRYDLGVLLEQKGNPSAALSQFKAVAAFKPDYRDIRKKIEALTQAGTKESAPNALDKALSKVDPDSLPDGEGL